LQVLKTTNGGDLWTESITGLGSVNLRAVHTLSTTTAFVVGDTGTVLKTTDSGRSWVPSDLLVNWNSTNIRGLFFHTALRGVIVGGGKISGASTLFTGTDSGLYY
jgi:photosystem II stability/assembly factor-like uncharacterized protein